MILLIKNVFSLDRMVFEETAALELFWRKYLPSIIRDKVGEIDVTCERAGFRLIKRDPTWERDLEFVIKKQISYFGTQNVKTAIHHVYTAYYVNKASGEEALGSVEIVVFV